MKIWLIGFGVALSSASYAVDLGDIGKIFKDVKGVLPDLPTSLSLKSDPDGLSMQADKMYPVVKGLQGIEPPDSDYATPQFKDGKIIFGHGYYSFPIRSYCLRAGTRRPGAGDSYALTPIVGEKSDVIKGILKRSALQPDVPQQEVQVLIWAVLSGAKLKNMSREQQATAAKLLTADELFKANGGLMGIIPDDVIRQVESKANSKIPDSYVKMVTAYRDMKTMFESGASTYEQIERVAMLGEVAPIPSGGRKKGEWHAKDGYLIRATPQGYSKVDIEIYRPLPPKLLQDSEGRVNGIDFNDGYKITSTYAGSGKGAALAEINLHAPSGTQSFRYSGDRYVKVAAGATSIFNKFISQAHAACPAPAPLPPYTENPLPSPQPYTEDDLNRFLSGRHYIDALWGTKGPGVGVGSIFGMAKAAYDFTDRIKRAGLYLNCVLSGACPPPGGPPSPPAGPGGAPIGPGGAPATSDNPYGLPPYDPANDGWLPPSPGSQRLGGSGAPAGPAGTPRPRNCE